MDIKMIDQSKRGMINEFIIEHWFTTQMVVRGESIDLSLADGIYAMEADEIIGLLTFQIENGEMEILSLDSIYENKGVGTELLNEAIKIAAQNACHRIKLITTNDNLNALQFYQKRGFDMIELYHNALDKARSIKPEIPLIGDNGIPLRHELELEMKL